MPHTINVADLLYLSAVYVPTGPASLRVASFFGVLRGAVVKLSFVHGDENNISYTQLMAESMGTSSLSDIYRSEIGSSFYRGGFEVNTTETVATVSLYRPWPESDDVSVGLDEVYFSFLDGGTVTLEKKFDKFDIEYFVASFAEATPS